jgi:hypothetical protein
MTVVGLWPIVIAGIASVLLGWLWFSPFLFGSVWMRIINLTPEMAERGKKKMHLNALLALIASMLAAWVMSYVGAALGVYDWFGALELGIWLWLGFTAPPMLGMVLWEQRPLRYYFIVAGYWLVAFILMALILVGAQMWGSSSQYGAPSGYPTTE